jgi:hypothetical protein
MTRASEGIAISTTHLTPSYHGPAGKVLGLHRWRLPHLHHLWGGPNETAAPVPAGQM